MASPAILKAGREKETQAADRYALLMRVSLIGATLLVSGLGLWWMLGPLRAGLWQLWTTNGLASIGMLFPLAAIVLAMRVWRQESWSAKGTWRGLPLCTVALLLASIVNEAGYPFFAFQRFTLQLFPVGLLVFVYVSGVVLLFLGHTAYRLALFPISLLLFLNPAPRVFTTFVDLPLQYAAAHTARTFAQWIGVTTAVDDLRLMFSPSLGMFIAPGCNGLRGALTMGFLTMIVAHIYRMPILQRIVYVTSGVILAYLLNLLRLCTLVLCYRVAIGFAPLAHHMEAADYVLGGLIFFVAAVFVIATPRIWNRLGQQYTSS